MGRLMAMADGRYLIDKRLWSLDEVRGLLRTKHIHPGVLVLWNDALHIWRSPRDAMGVYGPIEVIDMTPFDAVSDHVRDQLATVLEEIDIRNVRTSKPLTGES